ncbi:Hypothetical predicted protein [Pelobates cultripes]|uniref:Uncharacterized protein n=1 Tax=Pelobates cultripes TaxID=61616 RepID=A0AAD1RSW0_PELCU|nr:Hypothetical predicted protein [Pelobates cultripes]
MNSRARPRHSAVGEPIQRRRIPRHFPAVRQVLFGPQLIKEHHLVQHLNLEEVLNQQALPKPVTGPRNQDQPAERKRDLGLSSCRFQRHPRVGDRIEGDSRGLHAFSLDDVRPLELYSNVISLCYVRSYCMCSRLYLNIVIKCTYHASFNIYLAC